MNREDLEMAYVSSHRAANISFGDYVAAAVIAVKAALARRAVYNQTVRELQSLSSRDLSDLGISHYNIADIAREAAYGK